MITKAEFISDIEKLVEGELDILTFKRKYLLGPDAKEVAGVTDAAAPNLSGNLGHLVDDNDPNESEDLKKIQKVELRRLIRLLKTDAPASQLDEFHFYARTKEK